MKLNSSWLLTALAFVTPNSFTQGFVVPTHHVRSTTTTTTTTQISMSSSNIVVISSPGGVGEVSAVESAKRGASVRWFVISSSDSSSSSKVTFSEESLEAIQSAGGKLELAGGEASALLLSPEDPNSAIQAVSSWCGQSDAIIGCMDCEEDDMEERENMLSAIKVAAKEAANLCGGVKVAVGSVEEYLEGEDGEESAGPGVLASLSSLLGGKNVQVPSTLKEAMGRGTLCLRYGELFGLPESSKDSSAFVGGPRRDPILRDEYTTRSVRLDPSIAIAANPVLQSQTRSSRLSLGEAAALLALQTLTPKSLSSDLDICLASLRGSDALSVEEWTTELTRVENSLMDSKSGTVSAIFTSDFDSVPNLERMADWLATKWAPAILRTYEIAGIRTGARPVYAARTEASENDMASVEIVWQQLVDFEPKTVGKIVIDVTDTKLVARRVGVPVTKAILKPLTGEDVIVRSLADAAGQAVERGLATKPIVAKSKKPTKKVAAPVAAASTVISSGTVSASSPQPESAISGPRSAGAKRSSERTRGKRRKSSTNLEDPPSDSFQ